MDYSEYSGAVKNWIETTLDNRGVNAQLTLKCCKDIEQYAWENSDAKLLGFAYYYSGETYYLLNDGENLFRYITRAISYLDESKQWELVARAYNIMAITSVNRGNAPIAMDYYLTGLTYCKKYQLSSEENIIHMNLGSLYLNNGEYVEAQKYYEKAAGYIRENPDPENYENFFACIQINLGKCFLQRGLTERTKECVEQIERQCVKQLQKTELLCLLCLKVRLYHTTGRMSMRDECIREIQENVDENMAVMDIFDDFYELCQLLREIDNNEALWDILKVLEHLANSAKIINLQRKIISLKIEYYRMHKENAGYLQAAGLYYELTEAMERENQYMICNMLSVRNSLEQANEKRREVERANARLQEKSETDALTGLPNRFRLNDFSENAFDRALERGIPLAVEILDIDYFKEYNDNYGHQAGDECIIAIAEELLQMADEQVFCARYGGDEFIIIYEGMTEEEVFKAAEDLRQRILNRNISHLYSKALPVVTISQGICFDKPAAENRNWDFLHAADMMLYKVKKKSRNNISMGRLDECEIRSGY